MQKEKLLKILDLIGNNPFIGFTIIDQRETVLYRNKGMEIISGIKSETAIGKKFCEVSPDPNLLKVLKNGKPQLGVLHTTPSGTQAVIHRIPLKEWGRTFGAMSISVFHNVTEMKEILRKYEFMKEEMVYLKNEIRALIGSKFTFKQIVGESPIMLRLKCEAKDYAIKDFNILITGESGTGKEIFVHAIHHASHRKNGPFIRLNCSCFPRDLLESELFGYEEGSFTGAKRKGRPGKFELAHKGTIFLDEIGDLPLEMQPKLLRVLEEKEIWRIGSVKPRKIDFRLIASTNKNLQEMVEEEKFREDLYFRLSVLNLNLPSLTERKEDIPSLVHHLLRQLNSDLGTNVTIHEQTLRVLKSYHWPGNVRELRNALERGIAVSEDGSIKPVHLPPYLLSYMGQYEPSGENLGDAKEIMRHALEKAEREVLIKILSQVNGNKTQAARKLGISRPCLYGKLQKYELGFPNESTLE